jgi:hypothetical protein
MRTSRRAAGLAVAGVLALGGAAACSEDEQQDVQESVEEGADRVGEGVEELGEGIQEETKN